MVVECLRKCQWDSFCPLWRPPHWVLSSSQSFLNVSWSTGEIYWFPSFSMQQVIFQSNKETLLNKPSAKEHLSDSDPSHGLEGSVANRDFDRVFQETDWRTGSCHLRRLWSDHPTVNLLYHQPRRRWADRSLGNAGTLRKHHHHGNLLHGAAFHHHKLGLVMLFKD